MPTALLPMTDTRYLCLGGPLDGAEYGLETIRAALCHGFRYVVGTDDDARVWRFVGYRKPLPAVRPFVPLRSPSRWRWRVVAKG